VLAQDGPAGNSTRLATLADALLKRHDRTREAVDVAAAVERARGAVAATPPGDPDPGFQHMVLGLALLAAEEHDEAVAALRRAVDATDPGHPEYAARWSNLGLAYSERHGRAGERPDGRRSGRRPAGRRRHGRPASRPDRAADQAAPTSTVYSCFS
jgi:hypothetical protein